MEYGDNESQIMQPVQDENAKKKNKLGKSKAKQRTDLDDFLMNHKLGLLAMIKR